VGDSRSAHRGAARKSTSVSTDSRTAGGAKEEGARRGCRDGVYLCRGNTIDQTIQEEGKSKERGEMNVAAGFHRVVYRTQKKTPARKKWGERDEIRARLGNPANRLSRCGRDLPK